MVDVICVGFMGPGYTDGENCYYIANAKKSAISRPFEIWTNCEKMFQHESSDDFNHTFRKDKPKFLFLQLALGTLT